MKQVQCTVNINKNIGGNWFPGCKLVEIKRRYMKEDIGKRMTCINLRGNSIKFNVTL